MVLTALRGFFLINYAGVSDALTTFLLTHVACRDIFRLSQALKEEIVLGMISPN
jgi:hypothetical protein